MFKDIFINLSSILKKIKKSLNLKLFTFVAMKTRIPVHKGSKAINDKLLAL